MKKELTISYDTVHFSDLSDSDMELVKEARDIADSAYAPYSEFRVGAALRLEDGTLVRGSNQENIAYPSGLCAERVALFFAGANYPELKIKEICIVAHGELLPNEKNLSPCGSCRQVMVESEMRQNESYRVLLVNQDDSVSIFNTAKDLLPLTFGL